MPYMYPNRKLPASGFVSDLGTSQRTRYGNNGRMTNNLHKLRKEKRLSLEALAKIVGTTKATIKKLELGPEKGGMNMTLIWINRLAKGLGCTPEQIISDAKQATIPILFKIGAGAMVYPLDDHEPGAASERTELPAGVAYTDTLCAFRVEGDSQAPMLYDGWLVFADRRTMGGCEDITSKIMHIVEIKGGPTMLKLVRKGYTPGKYNLRSHNAEDIEDVELAWSAKIVSIVPK